jgi:hypothetical protein
VLLGANPLLARTGGPVVLDTRSGETLLVALVRFLLRLWTVGDALALGRAPRPVAPPMEVLMLFPGVSGVDPLVVPLTGVLMLVPSASGLLRWFLKDSDIEGARSV